MRSLLLPLGLVSIVGVASSLACTVSVSPGSWVVPTGGVTFTAYGSCDTFDGYAEITGVTVYSTYCGSLTCDGSYYALCNGAAWSGCDCEIPSGYVVVSGGWSDFGGGIGGGGDDGGAGGDGASGGDGGNGSETGGGDDGGGGGNDGGAGGDDGGGGGGYDGGGGGGGES
jgi:hypothetical protein